MIIGGGYSTGREIVQYTGRFGPRAWLGVVIIFVGFSLLSALAFELARIGKAYDYKNWIRLLIGPLWPLFDVLVLVMLLLTIAVMSAGMGSVLQETTGLPYAVGLGIVFGAVGLLAWKGTKFIERFKTVGSGVLYIAYLCYAALVLTSGEVAPPAAAEPAQASTAAVVVSAIQYVGYNLGVFPAVLFCLYRQTSRREAMTSGLLAGLSMTIPLALTFLCLMRFWPDDDVMGADVPWLPMLKTAAGGFSGYWIVAFGVVAGWTLLETAVGSIHALVDRLESNLEDLPAACRPESGKFRPWQRVALSVGILGSATLLAQFGIVALVERGYGALAWGFIILLAVPLLTVGVWRLRRS
jgi:uncharacterized membrane protein YkvI